MPKETLDNKVENTYVCMNCAKIFDEKVDHCIGEDGRIHSYFTDKESPWYEETEDELLGGTVLERKSDDSIDNYIFKFEVKLHDPSDKHLHFSGSYPSNVLKKAGFPQFYLIGEGKSGIAKDDLAKQFINGLNEAGKQYILYTTAGYPGFFHYDFRSKEKDFPHFNKLSEEFDNYLEDTDEKRIKIFEGDVTNVVNQLGWSGPPTTTLEINHDLVKRLITHCSYRINIGEKIEAHTKAKRLSEELRHPFKLIVYNEQRKKQFEYLNKSGSLVAPSK